MEKGLIAEVGIDKTGRLYIVPSSHKFPYIYREAMEVHWDAKDNFLYSPVSPEWTYLDWFKQIINAAQEQDCNLVLSNTTKWSDVPEPLKQSIHKWNEEYYSNL
jgi:hypothetical protein